MHADIAVYIATAYTIYYIWLCNVWEKILPRLNFNINLAAEEKAKFERLNNKKAMIGTWGEPNDEGVPNDQDLLWFRCAEGEELLFGESQRVMPGLIDTIMCGCGGNVYAVAVTSHRIIIQHDKRCLFGSTVLTTNEESYFVKNVHKANLNTDGCLNLGICTLHSSEMLSGGFNWIALGWIIDLILEWKPDLMNAITDERLKGWINMVPDDVIYMFSSVLVLFGAFLFLALLFFLFAPACLTISTVSKLCGHMRKKRRAREEGPEEHKDGGEHVDHVIRHHVDPPLEALIRDGIHQVRLPLENQVDDPAQGNPVEATRQHFGRVQRADAKIQAAVCVQVGLVDVLHEIALLVCSQHRAPEQAPFVVLDDDAVRRYRHGIDVAATAAHDSVDEAWHHPLRLAEKKLLTLSTAEPQQILIVGHPLVVGLAPRANHSLLVVQTLELGLLLRGQVDVKIEAREDFLPHVAQPDVINGIGSRDVHSDVRMPSEGMLHVELLGDYIASDVFHRFLCLRSPCQRLRWLCSR